MSAGAAEAWLTKHGNAHYGGPGDAEDFDDLCSVLAAGAFEVGRLGGFLEEAEFYLEEEDDVFFALDEVQEGLDVVRCLERALEG